MKWQLALILLRGYANSQGRMFGQNNNQEYTEYNHMKILLYAASGIIGIVGTLVKYAGIKIIHVAEWFDRRARMIDLGR